MSADERNEAASVQHSGPEGITAPLDKLQLLILEAANWYHHPAAVGELREKRARQCWRAGGHEDGVERCELRQAQRTVATMDVNVCVTQALKALSCGGREFRAIFDGDDFFGERAENGGLVAATSADFENAFLAVEA